MSIAAMWASRIMTVSIEMVLPGLLGLWIDARLGTKFVFGLIGFAIGMPTAVWHLLRMTSSADRDKASPPPGEREKPNP